MEMPTPSAGHRKLEKIAGLWEGEEKMYPSPWDPKGGTATGRIKSRVAVDGFALINDYEQERDGEINLAATACSLIIRRKTLHLSLGRLHGCAAGDFQGKLRRRILHLAHGGPGMHVRLTYDLSEPGYLCTSMEMSQDGNTWNRFFDARLKRC